MRDIRRISALLRFCTGLLLVSAQGANAQTTPGSTVEQPPVHIGPVYFTPTFRVKYLGVDSNVFNSFENQRSDFTFTMGPELQMLLPYRRLRLTTAGGLDYVYFKTYADQRGFNTTWIGRGEALLARFTLFAEVGVANTKERVNLELDSRRRRLEESLTLGVVVNAFPKVGIEFSGRQGSMTYRRVSSVDPVVGDQQDSERRRLNRDSRAIRARVLYRLTPLTTISVFGDAEQERLPLSPDRDKDIVRVGSSAEFKPRAVISGSAQVGLRAAKGLGSAIPDRTILFTSESLTYALPGAADLTVSAFRDVVNSESLLEPFFVINRFGLSLRRPIHGRFDVILDGSYSRYTYESAIDAEGQPVLLDPHRLIGRSYSVNVGYVMRRSTRVGLGVWYDTRRSNRSEFQNFDGLRAGTTVTYGF